MNATSDNLRAAQSNYEFRLETFVLICTWKLEVHSAVSKWRCPQTINGMASVCCQLSNVSMFINIKLKSRVRVSWKWYLCTNDTHRMTMSAHIHFGKTAEKSIVLPMKTHLPISASWGRGSPSCQILVWS